VDFNTQQLPPPQVELRIMHGIAQTKEQGIGLQYVSEEKALESLRNCVDHLNKAAAQSKDPSFSQKMVDQDKVLANKDKTLPDLELVNGKLTLSQGVINAIHQAYEKK
jgi:hypothetical protein